MAIVLRPEQEIVVQQAIDAGMFASADEVLDSALETIRNREEFRPALTRSQVAGRRIRELRRGVTLGGLSIRKLIDEGRE